MLALYLPAFENKKYTAYDRFHGNGPYGEIPTKKEPIRTLGFALPNRCSGLMFSVLVSYGPGSSPGRGHCVVFLSITLYSHNATLHPDV